jgi:uncharacterized protein
MRSVSLVTAGIVIPGRWLPGARATDLAAQPLEQFDYGDVALASDLHERQLEQTHSVLMGMSDDSLLKPFRQMSGLPAPGDDLGGWYEYNPDYKWGDSAGFAPSCTFGQWVSALARMYAITRDQSTRDRVLRLNRLYAQTISGDYYDKNRFPTYCYDKLVCGLIDSHKYAGDPDAFSILDRTTNAALPHFPKHAVEYGKQWRPDKDQTWTWDESYTISENLFLAYQRGAGARYRELAQQYLYDEYYDPLAEGRNVLAGRHAYSHVNSLSSAMQAYLTLGSEKHLRAARNAFEMLSQQSFVTGGWGPDEQLRAPDSPDVYASLTNTHASFETPCGSYAHFKLTRYLLRVTRDARYGDSMERVMYNTVLGARPLQPDGRAFYYADYNFAGRKVYSNHRFPCCSGTLPQVAADYGVNSYFRDPKGLYVNLYLPSGVRWMQSGAQVSLLQSGDYPFADAVAMRVGVSRPVDFTLYLRIPQWAGRARLAVNGTPWPGALEPASFAPVARRWADGDRIDLELPRTLRLEAPDRTHADAVALLAGPLVLFPARSGGDPPRPRRAELLAARQVAPRRWQMTVGDTAVALLPYVEIDRELYATVVTLAA